MLKIALSGCGGRMGRAVTELVSGKKNAGIVAGFDLSDVTGCDYPVYRDVMEFTGKADVILDFSTASALDHLIDYCISKELPLAIATTGHTEAQLKKLKEASGKIPVFKSSNMSLGISLLSELIKRAAGVLGEEYDVEIIEKHHNRKLDAPSGTALTLAKEVKKALPYDADIVFDRHERRTPRPKAEIGVSSVRGGTIVGVHEVLFAGPHEEISITHTAESREVFANGAVRAAEFIVSQKPGMYDMNDLVASV